MTCPSITELCARDASTAFAPHLACCPRCRALLGRIESSDEEVGEIVQIAPGTRVSSPEPGVVWTIWAPRAEEYLVAAILEANEEDMLILPLLSEGRWASEADVELDPDVLGYRAIAPVWASDRVLVEQAVEAVDKLSETCLESLSAAFDAFIAGEPLQASTGPGILSDEDPRLHEQAAVADWLRSWYSPWGILQGAEELGPVLAARREELDIDQEGLSDELGVEPQTWAAFEAATADPRAAVAVRVMARAIGELEILPSRRVISLAESSVRAHNEGLDVSGPAAMARRMQGTRRTSRRDPEVVEAAAREYGAALEKELGL
jgi:DNA-binding XRE family transcriptional regulator